VGVQERPPASVPKSHKVGWAALAWWRWAGDARGGIR
jgi:hypothetical protein